MILLFQNNVPRLACLSEQLVFHRVGMSQNIGCAIPSFPEVQGKWLVALLGVNFDISFNNQSMVTGLPWT